MERSFLDACFIELNLCKRCGTSSVVNLILHRKSYFLEGLSVIDCQLAEDVDEVQSAGIDLVQLDCGCDTDSQHQEGFFAEVLFNIANMADVDCVYWGIELDGLLELHDRWNSFLVNPKDDFFSEIQPIYSISTADAPAIKFVYFFLECSPNLLRILTLLGCERRENSVSILFEDIFGRID